MSPWDEPTSCLGSNNQLSIYLYPIHVYGMNPIFAADLTFKISHDRTWKQKIYFWR